uniref:Uncharacterized protein n=1 Tax=Candidatus Kentrum sp. TC TaxID=2126339 RepID=A0A450YZ42_9GAMM|nr:MAG: hypothetical protein BECKTC1821E_GA0114239_10704 [Candidatus Kentron sp. TC]
MWLVAMKAGKGERGKRRMIGHPLAGRHLRVAKGDVRCNMSIRLDRFDSDGSHARK